MRTFEFWYDVVCPYAYVGSTQIAALEADTGARALYQPFLLGGCSSRLDTYDPDTYDPNGDAVGRDGEHRDSRGQSSTARVTNPTRHEPTRSFKVPSPRTVNAVRARLTLPDER